MTTTHTDGAMGREENPMSGMQSNLEPGLVRLNAEKDPSYAPYCLRCSTMDRMKQVERFLWKCHCGAVHDERKCRP